MCCHKLKIECLFINIFFFHYYYLLIKRYIENIDK